MTALAIIIPVFNDWPSLAKLVEGIQEQAKLHLWDGLHIIVVNDGSTIPLERKLLESSAQKESRVQITILDLSRNVGHQNAIATGLGWVEQSQHVFDAVVVMDGDGEDRPQDIALLLDASRREPGKIVMAKRGKRQESMSFRCGYQIYKLLFWLLTGQRITFGNFSLLPASCLSRLTVSQDIWHSYAGGILRSKIPRIVVEIDRGNRYFGRSKMNVAGLILHGLSAIAVFVDICTVRVLLMSLGILLISGLGIATVIMMKFLGMASPGWASTMALLLTVVSLQSVVLSAVLVFILFIYRNINTESPVGAFHRLVKNVVEHKN